uniref:IS3 family transposase n=1 Tax=Corynebacterium variabile TaxID=1727 RepID=UPI0035E3D3DB
MRSQGHAVELICRVLREQGVAIAARTCRNAKVTGPSDRAVSDAALLDILHGLKGAPASLYGRRKIVAHLRRLGHEVAHCTVDRLMSVAGMNGVGGDDVVDVPRSAFVGVHDLHCGGPRDGDHGADVRAHDSRI